MSEYAGVDELEILVRAGHGIAVIVEGSSADEDPWFYGQWFGDRARQVTFFPQDGWRLVIAAVGELRRRCAGVPIYGIIDRDFAPRAMLDVDFAALGILRLPRYTLENYLLDPACWAAVFQFIFRRRGSAPDGWDCPGPVTEHIEAACRSCLDLAAHNMAIKFGNDNYRAQAVATPERERVYLEHPNALVDVNAQEKLRAWGQQLGCNEDLGLVFRQSREALAAAGPDGWQEAVSGKHILRVLQSRFPLLAGAGRFGLSHYLNLYMDRCPDPHPDLVDLIDRIVADSSHYSCAEGSQ